MKRSTFLLAVAFLVAACGGQGSRAAATPSASPVPSASAVASGPPIPVPLTSAYGVLATPTSADTYTVSIVAPDGKVAGSAQASSPTGVMCGDAAAAVVPIPVSTSDDRAYYMDAQGVVRFLTVQAETGRATTVPTGGGRRSMFAVSPDDQRIAVVVNDYTSTGVALKLYVEDLNGAATTSTSSARLAYTDCGRSAGTGPTTWSSPRCRPAPRVVARFQRPRWSFMSSIPPRPCAASRSAARRA